MTDWDFDPAVDAAWRVKTEIGDEPTDDWDLFAEEGEAVEHAEMLLSLGDYSSVYITFSQGGSEEVIVWGRYRES